MEGHSHIFAVSGDRNVQVAVMRFENSISPNLDFPSELGPLSDWDMFTGDLSLGIKFIVSTLDTKEDKDQD